jgi:hypothetical protein
MYSFGSHTHKARNLKHTSSTTQLTAILFERRLKYVAYET